MSFLIDTDICSAYLKGDGRVFNRFLQHGGRLHLSAVCVTELLSWALRRSAPPSRLDGLNQMLSVVTVLPVDDQVARIAGRVRAAMLDDGLSIATPDLLIAATALRYDLTLVTHNVRHFKSVPDLDIEDWLEK